MFTCLVPRDMWVFSNVAENAGTQKLEIRITSRSVIRHIFDIAIQTCYQENEEFQSCINALKVVPASFEGIVIRLNVSLI